MASAAGRDVERGLETSVESGLRGAFLTAQMSPSSLSRISRFLGKSDVVVVVGSSKVI